MTLPLLLAWLLLAPPAPALELEDVQTQDLRFDMTPGGDSRGVPVERDDSVPAYGPAAGGPRGGVLLLGDSLTVAAPAGGFGRALAAWLARRGYDVHVDAGVSAASEWFLNGGPITSVLNDSNLSGGRLRGVNRTLASLLARHPGTRVVIINLGTNELRGRAGAHALARLAGAGGRRCVWIGPPNMSGANVQPARVRAYEDFLRRPHGGNPAVTSSCAFVSSLRLTGPYVNGRTGYDGIHYSPGPSEAWARRVSAELASLIP